MLKINKSLTKITIILILLISSTNFAQNAYQAATVAFYNIENLFDTEKSVGYIDGTLDYTNPNYHISIPESDISKYDTVMCKCRFTYENIKGKKIIRPLILQDEFSPNGSKVWTKERYNQKIKNISSVLANIGKDVTQNAPVVIGLVEIENRKVVEDIANSDNLKAFDYGVVHFNSFDARGVDVALLYQKSRFTVTEAKPYVVELYGDNNSRIYTRDILRVSGLLDGEEVSFLVNHWPSRRGGEKSSMPFRVKAAEVMNSIINEIKTKNPTAKIIAMGDFNDDPINTSIKETLKTISKKQRVKTSDLYNPMEAMYKKGMGTLAYRDAWNLFDQIIVTGSLVTNSKDFSTYKIYKTEIFSPDYLISKEGQYKGYPNRMYGGDTYHSNGYSDHFPVYTILLKDKK